MRKVTKDVMKKVFISIITVLCLVYTYSNTVQAADSTVKIHIGDSNSARHHMSLAVGVVSDEFSFEVKGYEVKSSKYISGDKSVFEIVETSEGHCKVKGVGEGTGMLTLEIKTKEGTTLEEKVFISVYTRLEECQGIVLKDASVYRGATDNAKVENEDEKGKLSKGTDISIIASCIDYYYFRIDDGTTFLDDSNLGFIKKSTIKIPVALIEVDGIISLSIGQKKTLSVKILPQIADNKEVTYKSNNPGVAEINAKGVITANRAGTAIITVTTSDGNISASCEVNVVSTSNTVWKNQSASSSKPVQKKEKKLKIKAEGETDSSIKISWKKQKGVKTYKIQRANLKKGKFKTIGKVGKNKTKFIDKKVKFYTKYRYRLLMVKKDGTKKYSKTVTGRSKDSTVKMNLRISGVTANSISLQWDKQKYAKQYVIYRSKGKNDKYNAIKTVSKKTTKYTDYNLQSYAQYYYKVKVIKTNNKKVESEEVGERTKYVIDKAKNLAFFKEKYPFVCMDALQNINEYYVYDNYYSPMKYKFNGDTLEIHLYIEFAKYTGNESTGYTKGAASRTDGIDGVPYIELYKQGVKENYMVLMAGNTSEFQDINFHIDVIFHEKGNENYHAEQQFTEILIGGECPYCTFAVPYWYHETSGQVTGDNKSIIDCPRIYMPYNSQVVKNTKQYYNRNFPKEDYRYTAAHETAHSLGLGDAYTSENQDRFTDNEETGVLCSDDPNSAHDNLMVELYWDKPIKANDLEMMLYAYIISQGKPWNKLQSYKTNGYFGIVISPCISNQHDSFIDGE